MSYWIKYAFGKWTTHSTVHNDTSSRSHALCFIKAFNESNRPLGTLIMADLAGSERA